MISFAPTPIFSGTWEHHRPSVSSPLSSSPIRATSPLSPIDRNTLPFRHSQSSPIQPPKFKYSSRPTRPNPVVKKREEAQEQRRRTFLQSVRDKQENRKWERRDVEGQHLRKTLLASINQLSYDAPSVSDADIEEALAYQEESHESEPTEDVLMDEDEELEAMIASYEEQQQQPHTHLQPQPMSDDDYDDIFAELMAQEQLQHPSHASDQMDTTDGDTGMTG